ncbi:MAG: amino acid adenylation domain-containing protein, partial [bacterium]|nr:amino acid adenylation domain-containing protein [bacterium]
ESPAYIMYTEGLMGVMVEHRNVTAFLSAFYAGITLSSDDTVLSRVPEGSDYFVKEFYPLLWGIKSVVSHRAVPGCLSDLVARHCVTVVLGPPLQAAEMNGLPAGVKCVFNYGPGVDMAQGSETGDFPTDAGVGFVAYGPMESTGCTLHSRAVEAGENADLSSGAGLPAASGVSIGKPIANCNVYILDKYLRLVPPGVPGELCISGPGVVRGYMNRPGVVAEKFIHLPFITRKTIPGSPGSRNKVFRTGRQAVWNLDGTLLLL